MSGYGQLPVKTRFPGLPVKQQKHRRLLFSCSKNTYLCSKRNENKRRTGIIRASFPFALDSYYLSLTRVTSAVSGKGKNTPENRETTGVQFVRIHYPLRVRLLISAAHSGGMQNITL